MKDVLSALSALSAAEDFFTYLAVPFDPAVLNVNRLHILKRFNQYLRAAAPELEGRPPEAQQEICRDRLARAYDDFLRSTPAREKLFKVFRDAEGTGIGLESLRAALPSRLSQHAGT